jgi:hypothetical protein
MVGRGRVPSVIAGGGGGGWRNAGLQSRKTRFKVLCCHLYRAFQGSKVVAKLCRHHDKGRSPFFERLHQGSEAIGKLCCLLIFSARVVTFSSMARQKQVFGDVAVFGTDFVPEQAKLSLEGLQLGPNWGERHLQQHCKFTIEGGNCSFQFTVKVPLEHFAVSSLTLALPCTQLCFICHQQVHPFLVMFVNGSREVCPFCVMVIGGSSGHR